MSELPLLLVIEDEYLLQADIEKMLTDAGFATDIVSSGEEALTLLMHGTRRPSALISDVKLAGRLTGWEVAKRIREKDPSFPVIYVTAYDRDWPAYGVPNSIGYPKAVRVSAIGDRHFQSSQRRNAIDNVRPPQLAAYLSRDQSSRSQRRLS